MLIARIRAGLPTKEDLAGFVGNLYTDMLINNRLQRQEGLDMAGVYKKLNQKKPGKLWVIYMMMYENLWGLYPGSLTAPVTDARMITDAQLGARVIRAYSRDWLDGAGRFAMLLAPYIPVTVNIRVFVPLMDAENAGAGGEIPDGMVEIDAGELEGAIHPADDPAITGLDDQGDEEDGEASSPRAGGKATRGGKKDRYRSPAEYAALMKSAVSNVDEDALIIRYYRERAMPYLIKFPVKDNPEGGDPLPEGLETWDVGQPFGDLDWVETIVRSPVVIPGVTTLQRTYGASPGFSPDKAPPDMYIGIDCSGSMFNPKLALSYPCLAGVIVAISALRAGARVMACLSGEPGKYTQTDGFIRDEKAILKLLTGYLGTGYSYGVERLRQTFLKDEENKRPTHLLVITDTDIFHMLEVVKDGWLVIAQAMEAAGAGATFLLDMSAGSYKKEIQAMREAGWNAYLVATHEEMIDFARKFAKRMYDKPPKGEAKS
jgi:hypothetical protein